MIFSGPAIGAWRRASVSGTVSSPGSGLPVIVVYIVVLYRLNNRGEDRGDATSRNPLPDGRSTRQGGVQPGGVPALCGENPQPQRGSTDLRAPSARRRRSG